MPRTNSMSCYYSSTDTIILVSGPDTDTIRVLILFETLILFGNIRYLVVVSVMLSSLMNICNVCWSVTPTASDQRPTVRREVTSGA